MIRPVKTNGTAPVYLAREEGPMDFTRDVELKMVAGPRDASLLTELSREAVICSKLNHPGIVRIFDFFEYDHHFVLVLEHVDGISLADLQSELSLKSTRLSDHEIFYVAASVLEALAHAHALTGSEGEPTPVVHGGVSPAAIQLARDGAVKLGGFGFAKIRTEGVADGERDKSDVHAVGLLLWELLGGEPVGDGRAPLSSLRRDVPREIRAAIEAALDPSLAERTITCAEMASWIRTVAPVATGKKELRERMAAIPKSALPVLAPIAPPPSPRIAQKTLFGLAPAPASPSANEPASFPAVVIQHSAVTGASTPGLVLPASSVAQRTLAHLLRSFRELSRGQRHAVIGAACALVLFGVFLPILLGTSPPLTKGDLAVGASAGSPGRGAAGVAGANSPPPAPLAAAREPGSAPHARGATPAPSKTRLPSNKYGHLTIHSTIDYAYVYVQLVRYGRLEQPLTVPCGKQFVAIGRRADTNRREPIWFAPGRFIDVPCGGEIEATMLPRPVRESVRGDSGRSSMQEPD